MGYEKASMRSIGDRCQMTAAGIYRHCKDKADLFDQLVAPAMENLNAWAKDSCEEATGALETLEKFFLPGWKLLMGI